LLVKRFDRDRTRAGYCRARMISGLTVLRADETPAARNNRWSYVLLAEELRRVVAEPKRDTFELFQRICFNALISNIDDHPRNHALIAKARAWTLSPAFDLTPSPVIAQDRRDLAMTVGDMGRFANARNIQSQSARFLLEPRQAAAVVSDMTGRVRSTWYDVVRSCGVSEQDAETVRRAFVYEGFLRE
jgi:serine/threonine-protein kinase HipA